MKLTARCGSARSPELITCAPISAGMRPPVGLRDLDRRLLLCNASMRLVLPLARNGHCPGVLRSVHAREHDDRDLPGGLLLILGKIRHLFGLAIEQPLALLARRHHSPDLKAFVSQFDRCYRVGD